MKFIHISDLHIGKRVNGFSMIEDQKYILTKIINIIDEEKPDGILIAGDIFDKSVPGEDAIGVWDSFINKLAKRKIHAFVISGNHDSAIRLSEHRALVDMAGIHISPVYDGKIKPYTFQDDYGKLNIYMLPFIKPGVVRAATEADNVNNYTDACRTAIERMNINEAERNVLMAHQFVTGAKTCESEEIAIGGLDNVDATVFEAFDYVALGHIHGPQSIGRETIRYSGTPLKYSFSEINHKKSVTIAEIKDKGNVEIRKIELKPKHEMRKIEGKFYDVIHRKNCEEIEEDAYVHIILKDEEDVPDAIGKLKVVYPNMMKLTYDNTRTRENKMVTGAQDVENKSQLEHFEEFYELQNNRSMSEEQRGFCIDIIKEVWGI